MKRLALLAGLLLTSGYMVRVDGDLDPLRDAARQWTYELVGGPSVDALAVLPKSSPVTCGIKNVTSTTSQFVCDVAATGQPLEAGLVTATRTLYWDGKGVRELRGEATPEAIADGADAFALTFPSSLTTDGSRLVKTPAGARASFMQTRETRKVSGQTQQVWISEATTTAAPVKGMPAPVPVKTLAVFLPGFGPVLLCHVRDQYVCLRLVETAAPPAAPTSAPVATLTVARKLTRLKTSLGADKLAAKVTSTYGAAIKRCYADARRTGAKAGTLALKLTVNAVGKTEAINVKSFDAKLTACVKALVGTWRFPIPLGEYGSPIAARYELDLKLAMKK